MSRLWCGHPVNLRPMVAGRQGCNWAVAPMLGAGATSWGLQMVAGADLEIGEDRAALVNRRSRRVRSRLADTHYVMEAYHQERGHLHMDPESPPW